MAKVRITQNEEQMLIWLDDAKEAYTVNDWAVRQVAGQKPLLTFILPVTVEVDSLSFGEMGAPSVKPEPEVVEEKTDEVQWVRP